MESEQFKTNTMLAKYTALTLSLLANCILASQSELDCTKRLDYNTVESCCARPNLNFDAFRGNCGQYMKQGTPQMSPCLHECIFQTENVLNGMELNVENGERMLQKMLGNNKEFVDVYVRSLRNCTENLDKLQKRLRRHPFSKGKCSIIAVFLGMCTLENAYVHCPTASWRNSKLCENSRAFMLNCKCDETHSVCIQL